MEEKQTSIKQRVADFVYCMRISMSEFERRCGLSNGYVSSMRHGFGTNKLKAVLAAFPNLNRDWLLYGEGNMLKDPEQKTAIQNIAHNNSIIGDHNTAPLNNKVLDLLNMQEQSLIKAQDHISRLITLLERQHDGDTP